MRIHFIPLFKRENINKTIIFAVIAVLLISASIIIGVTDNLPMIAIFFAGIIFIYFAVLHPWKKASSFAVLFGVCFVILILDFIWPFISEGIAMGVGFVCLAGIISGIIGIFSRIKSWRRLPFSASLLSIIALAIISSCLNNPNIEHIAPMSEWMLIIGLQIFVTILLFIIGLINKRERYSTKVMLFVATLVLVLLSVCGFYASTWQYGEAVNSKGFARLMFIIFGSIEIIIASLSIYANVNKKHVP